MTNSTVRPEAITIVGCGSKTKVYLAKDIIENSEGDYSYNEVIFMIDSRDNLRKSIEDNFDIYWQYGEQQIQYNRDIESKQKELHDLINGMKLVDELSQAKQLLADIASIQLGV